MSRLAELWLPTAIASLLAGCTGSPAPRPTTTVGTASGHVYPVLSALPLVFKDLGRGFRIEYVTTTPLSDEAALRIEALELATEYLRARPRLVQDFPKGIVVAATSTNLVDGYHTPISADDVTRILAELEVSARTLHTTAVGWSRFPRGPIEEIREGKRGETFYYLAIAEGEARDEKGTASVELSAHYSKPDGGEMSFEQPVEVPASAGPLVLAGLFIRFDPGDAGGTYRIRGIRMTDRHSGQSIDVPDAQIELK